MIRRRNTRFKKHLVHFIAQCQDCGFYTEDYLKGPRRAAQHAAITGHAITGDMGYGFWYIRVAEGAGEGKA